MCPLEPGTDEEIEPEDEELVDVQEHLSGHGRNFSFFEDSE